MEKVEFRVTADGRVMYRIAGKEEKRLTKFTKDIVEPMTALIHDRFPECYARLATIYRKNVTKMVDRFVRCNFGEEDLLSDDVEHDLLHFEEVRCPLRGICEDERVICKPKTLVNLSNGERTVTKLYLNGHSLDDIAEHHQDSVAPCEKEAGGEELPRHHPGCQNEGCGSMSHHCANCPKGRNCINGKWCVQLGVYVQYMSSAPCQSSKKE